MLDLLQNNVPEAVFGLIIILTSFVEVSKIKINPWSSLFGFIGKALTKDISNDIKEMAEDIKNIKQDVNNLEESTKSNSKAIEGLDKKVDEKMSELNKELKEYVDLSNAKLKKDSDEKEAKRLRANIIQFADSCRVGARHTQNHFENIFRDYDDYIEYCRKNDIPNNFIDTEKKYICEVYNKCIRENKFI